LRLLLLSFYYPPDLCAGSFRCKALVDALLSRSEPVPQLHVITTQPNRYSAFAKGAPAHEEAGAAIIDRVELPAHESGMLDQARAFGEYARRATALANGEYDVVIGTSSRLMTAALAARLARRHAAPLYLDIRDIFADTMAEVLPRFARPIQPSLELLERWTMRQASHINLVSPGFLPYFRQRYPHQHLTCHTNGVDEIFERAAPKSTSQSGPAPHQVLYAGNIGDGQGLHHVVRPLAQAAGESFHFEIIGAGGRHAELQRNVAGLANVALVPPMDRDSLLERYASADVLFLHLNDYAAFRKVLPSKLFEYAALGKPILGGVAGYAAQFMREEISNCAVFTPCNAAEGARVLRRLELRTTPRSDFIAKYSRSKIMDHMASEIVALAKGAAR
jgi:glycosyltransferase involved in cell wall biosynthesis